MVLAEASKTDVTVGEVFSVKLSVAGPAGTVWKIPAEVGDEQVELRTPSTPGPPSTSPPPPGTHRYEAVAFALGEAEVPPIPVEYRLPDGTEGEVSSEPIPLRILSVLPKDSEEQKLIDVRAPLAVSIGRAFWLSVGLLLFVLAAAVFWFVRRRRQAAVPETPREPPVPPDSEALGALDRLAASGLAARGEFKAFYVELTQIAKRYLERRLGAPVLEMTTAEMVAFIRDHAHSQLLLSPVKDLAGAADLVKFARGAALVQETERHLAAVRDWIGQLEARLRPSVSRKDEAA
jgi:hypothetical protein